MRVFFDNKIQKNYSNEKYIEFVFHPVHPLIAVSSSSQSGGQVLAIYQEDVSSYQSLYLKFNSTHYN